MAWKHRKLLMNLGNGVDAAFAQGDAADELARAARAEGEAALAAAGIAVVSARRRTASARRHPAAAPDRRPHPGGSTWQSLTRGGAAVEIDYLSGEIVLLGRLHGVPTPVNELIQRDRPRLARTGGASPQPRRRRTALADPLRT